MYERAMSFVEYVGFYGLTRSRAPVLRYLADGYKALRQDGPEHARTEEVADLTEWLGELVRQDDSSLLDEWEMLMHPTDEIAPPKIDEKPRPVTANARAFKVLVRNAMFRGWSSRDPALGPAGRARPGIDWGESLAPYFAEYDAIGTGPDARGPHLLLVTETPDRRWEVRQVLDDPAGDHDWGISAEVDLAASDEEGTAVLRVSAVDQL
jgi:hypothetical protein